ncbi:MAG: pyridoxal phosphate-dependent aminotransferase [Pseudomonadota bacterium]|nr:pyridoxal phosphate-dependent aminotransferase [Pseudomonadota bacterium]
MSQPFTFSHRVRQVPAALSIHINEIVYAQKRRGFDITTLSLGEAFFDLPLFDFRKIDFVKGYHYSDSQGLPELRRLILEFYASQYGCELHGGEEVMITAGSKAAIYMAMLATVNAGEEVLIHEPAWLSYQEHARLVDATPRFIPFATPIERFGDYLGERARMLIINNPNNPAGRLYSADDLRALVALCRERNVWLLVDEAYSDFLQPGLFRSALDFDPERRTVIIANSLSKNMGMSGWRIGYLIAHPDLIAQVLKLNQHIITCAPTVLQAYLVKYFHSIIGITLPQALEVVAKRERVAAKMREMGITHMPGCGTFYFFVSIGDFPASSLDLSLYLLLFHNIATVSGSAYGASTERFLRISIGTETEERIADALAVIRNVLHARPDVAPLVANKLRESGFSTFQATHD